MRLSPRGLSPLAFTADIRKGPGSIHELATISFTGAKSDLLAQFCEPEPFQFLALLEQAQSFPQDFALRLIQPGLEQIGHKVVEYGTQVDVHGRSIIWVNNSCQFMTIQKNCQNRRNCQE